MFQDIAIRHHLPEKELPPQVGSSIGWGFNKLLRWHIKSKNIEKVKYINIRIINYANFRILTVEIFLIAGQNGICHGLLINLNSFKHPRRLRGTFSSPLCCHFDFTLNGEFRNFPNTNRAECQPIRKPCALFNKIDFSLGLVTRDSLRRRPARQFDRLCRCRTYLMISASRNLPKKNAT
jgi:hypothetical protein